MTQDRPHRRDVIVVQDAEALARQGAALVREGLIAAATARGRATIALAGGRTPRALYTALAHPDPTDAPIPWHVVHVFFGDERHVPPEHPDSNYGMASQALLSRVPILPEHIHRVRAEEPDADRVAAEYAETLRTTFDLTPGRWPRFDLVLLGMGADGHTASLFPGTTALDERDRLVTAVRVDTQSSTRITLTYPVLNHARRLIVLVSGHDKAATLQAVLDGPPKFPIQRVVPDEGRMTWLVDEAAAHDLRPSGLEPPMSDPSPWSG